MIEKFHWNRCGKIEGAVCRHDAAANLQPPPHTIVPELARVTCWPCLVISINMDNETGEMRLGRPIRTVPDGEGHKSCTKCGSQLSWHDYGTDCYHEEEMEAATELANALEEMLKRHGPLVPPTAYVTDRCQCSACESAREALRQAGRL